MKRSLPVLILLAALSLAGCIETRQEASDDITDARQAMLQRDYLEAEKSFERYLRRNPEGDERWEVWNTLVDIALSVRGDRKAAIELLEAMLIEYADVPARKRVASARLAELYRLARNYSRALVLWSSVAGDPNAENVERARACRSLAHVYLRRLEFELAEESLGYCLALDIPDTVRAECLYDLAQTHMGMNDLDQAIIHFRSVLTLNNIPESMRTLTVFMLADALEQKGDAAEALELYAGIEDSYPNRKVVEQRIEFLRNDKTKKSASAGRSGG